MGNFKKLLLVFLLFAIQNNLRAESHTGRVNAPNGKQESQTRAPTVDEIENQLSELDALAKEAILAKSDLHFCLNAGILKGRVNGLTQLLNVGCGQFDRAVMSARLKEIDTNLEAVSKYLGAGIDSRCKGKNNPSRDLVNYQMLQVSKLLHK